jgi:D-alanine-D-alanine ligase
LEQHIERRLRVAVLIPDPFASYPGRGDENFEYEGAEASDRTILRAVGEAGFEPMPFLVHLGNVETTVSTLDCDAVLNLCDGSGAGHDGSPGVEVIEALERRGLPYTGARAEAYRIGCDKALMMERFAAAGVPTPRFQLMRSAADPIAPQLQGCWPLLVKPRDTGGGAGIRLSSVVETEEALRAQVESVSATYGEALVTEYIDGRELTVGIVGAGRRLAVFPPLEVRFGPAFPAGRGLRTFDCKWDVHSPLYGAYEPLCPAPLRPFETRRVLCAARAAYRAIRGTGYGRVDLRMDWRGPFVLEVNPNCCLEWSERSLADCAMFPIGAAAAGFTFPGLLRELIGQALRRPVRRVWASVTRRPAVGLAHSLR